ncbi:hypothetical protein [Phytohabitans suffuscus]|uniref:Uncharacterized protein n=1 Tax=Phytohabitans suffuscus TaxID=624315 RepID=A0A6F8YNW2_9ACTN|nr:hypothetical protein [Phytohabitans suffuscus]BCB87726.1 hypothetical protein Psuf_050390 [Phytohabitans suffuscus]
MIHSINSDATKAVITVAAQRIAAYADREQIPIEQAQCEELAEDLAHVYQAFFAGYQASLSSLPGVAHGTQSADSEPTG